MRARRPAVSGGEQVGELAVAVEGSEFIGDTTAEGALGKGGESHTLGLFGDRGVRSGME